MLLLPCDVPASWRRRCRDSWCVINLKVVLWTLGKTSIRPFVLEHIWVMLSIFEEQYGRQFWLLLFWLLHFWCFIHFFSSPKSQTDNPFLLNGLLVAFSIFHIFHNCHSPSVPTVTSRYVSYRYYCIYYWCFVIVRSPLCCRTSVLCLYLHTFLELSHGRFYYFLFYSIKSPLSDSYESQEKGSGLLWARTLQFHLQTMNNWLHHFILLASSNQW